LKLLFLDESGDLDPYLRCLDVIVDRLCFEIGDVPSGGAIIAERRNPVLDRELDIAGLNLKVQGARHMRACDIDNRISGLTLASTARRDCLDSVPPHPALRATLPIEGREVAPSSPPSLPSMGRVARRAGWGVFQWGEHNARRIKKDNLAGLQLADLVLSPIGRHLMGKPARADWTIIESKFRRGRDRKIEENGLVVLPKR